MAYRPCILYPFEATIFAFHNELTIPHTSSDLTNSVNIPDFSRTDDLFFRLMGTFGLLLFGLTFSLWTPQTVFPQVPMVSLAIHAPPAVDWALLGLVGIALTSFVVFGLSKARLSTAVFVSATICLMILNQHRLQPWAIHLMILSTFMSNSNRTVAKAWLCLVAASIYLYSGIAKVDFQFANSLGQEFIQVIFGFAGIETKEWEPNTRALVATSLPAIEILVGILLVFKKTRLLGLAGGILLHLSLILILGPLGLQHYPPVLVWNLFFIFKLIFLFGLQQPSMGLPYLLSRSSLPLLVLTMIVLVFPAARLVDACDHWLGWELYAPRSSRAKLELVGIPTSGLRPFTYANGRFAEVDLAEMSLKGLGVPVYPQQRFQVGVILWLLEKHGVDRARVTLLSESNRFTGLRTKSVYSDEKRLREVCNRFWLNSLPRDL